MTIQIIHIEGPLKGEIQEFSEAKITFGRHPDCDVVFPADQQTISRNHAYLEREGNRYKLVDTSSNGTIVNSRPVKEVYLKNGDVITFSPNGPKVGFSATVTDLNKPLTDKPNPGASEHIEGPEPIKKSSVPEPSNNPRTPSATATASTSTGKVQPLPRSTPSETVKTDFHIQYGPTLQSFDTLPISIGSNPRNQLVLTTAGIADKHAMINFKDQKYVLTETSGKNLIRVNGQPIPSEYPMSSEDSILLTEQGPCFLYLNGGRLMQQEIELPPAAAPDENIIKEQPTKKNSSLLSKFFKRH